MDEVKRAHDPKLSLVEIEHVLHISTNPMLELQYRQLKLLEEILRVLAPPPKEIDGKVRRR